MTFLELQRQITQTRKARKGIFNRHDYFENIKIEEELVWKEIYKRGLRVANEVIKHYEETGYDPAEKISITFGDIPKVKSDKTSSVEIKKENHKLQAEIIELKKQLEKFHRGGRKSYDETMIRQVKSARDNGETWRGLAARIGISTTTAQKLYRMR